MKKALFVLGAGSLLKAGATGGLELSLFELCRRLSPYLDIDVAVRQVRDAGGLPIRWDLSSRYPSDELLSVESYISRIAAAADEYDAVVGFDAASVCQAVERPIANIFVSHLGDWFPDGPTEPCRRHFYAFPGRWMIEQFGRDHPREAGSLRRCRHLPMGVDVARFRPRRRTPGAFTLGFAGQWMPEKGLFDFLDAAKLLRGEIADLRLCCAGDAELWEFGDRQEEIFPAAARQRLRQEVEERFAELGGNGHLGLLDHEAMPRFWSEVDIAVVPSTMPEAGPIVAMEALACAAPVVGSDVCGVNELVRPGRNGELFPPGEPEELAERCLELYREPDRLREYRWNARRSVLGYSWDHAAQILLEIVHELCAR